MTYRSHRAAASLALGLLLSGCAYHLRKPPDLPPQMHKIYIASSGHDADIVRDLRRALASDQTEVVMDPTQASAVLSIISVQNTSRPLVLNRLGQPLVYQVQYRVEYTMVAGGVVLIPPEILNMDRDYNYSVANSIGNDEQEQSLYGALAQDMTQLILFRMQAVARNIPPLPATNPVPAAVTRLPAAGTRAVPAATTAVPVVQ